MSIVFARIDDRLIHGQVATTWIRNLNIEQVAVINDQLSQDPVQVSIVKMAAPVGVRAVLINVKDFLNAYKKGFKKRTMIILTNPQDVLRLVNEGVKFPYLNVGGMKYKEGMKRITEAVSVTKEDMRAFKDLIQKGIKVEIQMVPSSSKENFEKYLF